jgi:phosphate transport system substrate-binding protein
LIRTRRWAVPIALLTSFTLLAAACGDDDESAQTTDDTSGSSAAEGEPTGGEGDELSGTIDISGSSTVEPISIAVAERFREEHPGVDISVDGPGTGDGFELFCQGETDINDASSKIKDEQIAACEDGGIEFVELQIGNDGIAVMTNQANEAVTCLTLADIYALVGPESQGFGSWNDAEPLAEELGSTTDLPDAPLDITGPGEESGTYSSFVELVIEEFNEDRGEEAQTRPDYQASADDNVIIQGIQGSDTSFGWVGFAFAREAEDVKVLEVDGGDGCVAPTDETIADNSYPVSRPLFIYVNVAKAEENPALSAFVDFYLGDAIDAVSEVGYVDLAREDLVATQERWDARTAGAA